MDEAEAHVHRRKKAHLNGVVKDDERAYVSMEGDPPGRCRRLRKWLYGMRHAASAWEEDFSSKLAGMGLKAGKSSAVVFCDVEREVRCVVHGDDFSFLAYEDELERIKMAMSKAYLMTVRGVLGPDLKDKKEITILNRKLVWSEVGLTYEADANHAKNISWRTWGCMRRPTVWTSRASRRRLRRSRWTMWSSTRRR